MRQTGFTVLELVIVVIILGIVAVVAMPQLSSSDFNRLDIAASEIADAADFARTEALRTKSVYGIDVNAANDQIRVYSKPAGTAVYAVYHPIDKKLYDIQLKANTQTVGVDLVSASFTFSNSTNSTLLDFNSDGMPKYTATTDYMLSSGAITLSYNGQTRKVIIAPMTGRVTIQ
jgi:prepilin-type N-terminal cleavage/methylation domain-containing protein